MAHNPAVIVLVVLALAIVAFWRTVIKFLIAIAATAVIGAVGYGAIMLWQNVHHVGA